MVFLPPQLENIFFKHFNEVVVIVSEIGNQVKEIRIVWRKLVKQSGPTIFKRKCSSRKYQTTQTTVCTSSRNYPSNRTVGIGPHYSTIRLTLECTFNSSIQERRRPRKSVIPSMRGFPQSKSTGHRRCFSNTSDR